MGAGIVRMALTFEGLVFMAIGTVGLLASEEGHSPFLPDSPLTNLGLLVLGTAIAAAAQQPGPRRVVAWVQAIGFTAKLVSVAAGNPIQLPWHGRSALVGTILLMIAVMSLSAAERAPVGPADRRGRRARD